MTQSISGLVSTNEPGLQCAADRAYCSDMIGFAATAGLVLAQAGWAVPAQCFDQKMFDSTLKSQRAMNASSRVLSEITLAHLNDGVADGHFASQVNAETLRVGARSLHLGDLMAISRNTKDEFTRGYARSRLEEGASVTTIDIDALTNILRRVIAGAQTPGLAGEVRLMIPLVSEMKESLSACVKPIPPAPQPR